MTHQKDQMPDVREFIKANPHEDYDMLRRQFLSLKSMCNSMGEQLSYYRGKSYETGEKHLTSLKESLDSEKAMNAKLTEEIECNHSLILELKERLEIDQDRVTHDGIYNRDQTICMLEQSVTKLKQERDLLARGVLDEASMETGGCLMSTYELALKIVRGE